VNAAGMTVRVNGGGAAARVGAVRVGDRSVVGSVVGAVVEAGAAEGTIIDSVVASGVEAEAGEGSIGFPTVGSESGNGICPPLRGGGETGGAGGVGASTWGGVGAVKSVRGITGGITD